MLSRLSRESERLRARSCDAYCASFGHECFFAAEDKNGPEGQLQCKLHQDLGREKGGCRNVSWIMFGDLEHISYNEKWCLNSGVFVLLQSGCALRNDVELAEQKQEERVR